MRGIIDALPVLVFMCACVGFRPALAFFRTPIPLARPLTFRRSTQPVQRWPATRGVSSPAAPALRTFDDVQADPSDQCMINEVAVDCAGEYERILWETLDPCKDGDLSRVQFVTCDANKLECFRREIMEHFDVLTWEAYANGRYMTGNMVEEFAKKTCRQANPDAPPVRSLDGIYESAINMRKHLDTDRYVAQLSAGGDPSTTGVLWDGEETVDNTVLKQTTVCGLSAEKGGWRYFVINPTQETKEIQIDNWHTIGRHHLALLQKKKDYFEGIDFSPRQMRVMGDLAQLTYDFNCMMPAEMVSFIREAINRDHRARKGAVDSSLPQDRMLSYLLRSPDGENACLVLLSGLDLYVAFRGTQTWGNLWQDVSIFKEPQETGGRVHSGFNKAQKTLWKYVHGFVSVIRDHRPGIRLWITGHSMGGAMALITALDFAELQVDIQGVYVFGTAAPFDGERKRVYENHRLLRGRTFTIKFWTDPIPSLLWAVGFRYPHSEVRLSARDAGIRINPWHHPIPFYGRVAGDLDQDAMFTSRGSTALGRGWWKKKGKGRDDIDT